LARWQLAQPFTNGDIEACYTQITSQQRQSDGFRNRARYRRQMLLGFHPPIPIPLGLA